MTLKGALVGPVRAAAYRTGLSALRSRVMPGIRVIRFHGVDGVRHPVPEFREKMEYLARHFRVVPLRRVVDALEGPGSRRRREVAITFDDGLRTVFTNAYPVLRELGLPASVFVCPGLVDAGRWLWNHEARERLRDMPAPARARLLAEVGCPSADLEAAILWMKSLPLGTRKKVEEAVRGATPGFSGDVEDLRRFHLMGWEEVRALDSALITIGSHTLTHPILPTLTEAEIETELVGSRRRLEEVLGRRVEYLAYPNGTHDERVVACARRVYRAALGTRSALVRAGDDPWRIPRIHAAPPPHYFAWRLHRPTA